MCIGLLKVNTRLSGTDIVRDCLQLLVFHFFLYWLKVIFDGVLIQSSAVLAVTCLFVFLKSSTNLPEIQPFIPLQTFS